MNINYVSKNNPPWPPRPTPPPLVHIPGSFPKMEASLSVLSAKTLPAGVLECSNSRSEGGVGDSSY